MENVKSNLFLNKDYLWVSKLWNNKRLWSFI